MRRESQLVNAPSRCAPYAIQAAPLPPANAELCVHPARFLAVLGGGVCTRTDHKRSVRYAARVAEQATHWIRVAGTIGHPEHAKNRGGRGVMGVRASIFRVFWGTNPPFSTLNGTPHPYTGAYHGNFCCPGPLRLGDTRWEQWSVRGALQSILVAGRSLS